MSDISAASPGRRVTRHPATAARDLHRIETIVRPGDAGDRRHRHRRALFRPRPLFIPLALAVLQVFALRANGDAAAAHAYRPRNSGNRRRDVRVRAHRQRRNADRDAAHAVGRGTAQCRSTSSRKFTPSRGWAPEVVSSGIPRRMLTRLGGRLAKPVGKTAPAPAVQNVPAKPPMLVEIHEQAANNWRSSWASSGLCCSRSPPPASSSVFVIFFLSQREHLPRPVHSPHRHRRFAPQRPRRSTTHSAGSVVIC